VISTTVTADQVAGELGYMVNHLMQRAREFKIPFTERQVSQHHATQTVFAVDDAVELIRRCRAYLERTSTEGRARTAAAMRRLEVRIGQLLGPAEVGANQHSGAPHRDEGLHDQQRSDFRRMAEHEDVVEEVIAGSTDEEAAKRARREGEPMTWERFLKRSA
jgi:hypothetical protein